MKSKKFAKKISSKKCIENDHLLLNSNFMNWNLHYRCVSFWCGSSRQLGKNICFNNRHIHIWTFCWAMFVFWNIFVSISYWAFFWVRWFIFSGKDFRFKVNPSFSSIIYFSFRVLYSFLTIVNIKCHDFDLCIAVVEMLNNLYKMLGMSCFTKLLFSNFLLILLYKR